MKLLFFLLVAASLPAQSPYRPSEVVAGMRWSDAVLRLGQGSDGKTGDNWPITWAADDSLFTSYGDGGGFADPARALTLGFARILGNPPWHRGEDILSDADTKAGWGDKGIKSSGLLSVDGTLYLFVRNYRVKDDYRHARLAWSRDGGKTWTWARWYFEGSFGCPEFVQFGPDYAGARDGYVYLVSQDNGDAYDFAPGIVLARVPKARVAERSAWEFFSGQASGAPQWSGKLEARQPVFSDPRGAQRVSLSYNAGLRRYFLTASHRVGEGVHNASLGVFDAPEPWGPWTTVYYDDHWSGNDRTYHHRFPPKWISADGRSMWLLYSGLGGGNYAFCLRRAELETAPAAGGWRDLFDGRTLNGWRIAAKPADRGKNYWSVRDGTLFCDSLGRPQHDYVWLMTDAEFGDFELGIEVRGFAESPGNTGVQVRSRYDEAAGWLDGPQVDVHPSGPWRSGLIYDETRGTQRWVFPSLPDWRMEREQGPREWGWHADGWNALHILCRGTRIVTRVNGYKIADFDGRGILDDAGHRARNVGLRGHIALQLHVRDELRVTK